MCAGTTRFARDFRNLGSQWDPSDVGKRMEQENCVVCMARTRVIVFVPCGHLVCCADCAQRCTPGRPHLLSIE